jgi:acetyltransferase-like isoleucine patch superfamily enzyme
MLRVIEEAGDKLREKELAKKIKLKLTSFPFIGDHIKNKIIAAEGGEGESLLLREIAKCRNVYVDKYTYGGCFHPGFNTGGTCYIGRYCSVAQNVKYFGANHPLESTVLSAYFYNKVFGLNVDDVERAVLKVDNDVWIGYGAIITAGCHHIGNGAVIGAGSVVTKDIPAYAIAAGNPAKILRMRFSEDIVTEIEKSRWWEMKPIEVYQYYNKISNPLLFCREIRGKGEQSKENEK